MSIFRKSEWTKNETTDLGTRWSASPNEGGRIDVWINGETWNVQWGGLRVPISEFVSILARCPGIA